MHIVDSCNGNPHDLKFLVRPARDTTRPAPALILLHGYGSNEHDLFAISERIPAHWMVISVRAPFAISTNQFMWYDAQLIDDKIVINSEDASMSRQLILDLITQFIQEKKVQEGEVVVAGFSQGGNMALCLAVTRPERVWAAGCFSGRFLEEFKPLIKKKDAFRSREVFIAHGIEDQMLPLRYAEESQEILQGLGIEVTLITDSIAHSISSKELDEFVLWLNHLKI